MGEQAGEPTRSNRSGRRDGGLTMLAAVHRRDVGGRIRGLRRSRGLSQAVVAHLVGHSERWLRDVETGAVDLWVSDALQLAEALQVDVAKLLGSTDDGRSPARHATR